MKFEELEISEVRTVHDVPKPGAGDRNEVTQQFRAIDYAFEHCPPGILIIDKKTKSRKWVHLNQLKWVDTSSSVATVMKVRTG